MLEWGAEISNDATLSKDGFIQGVLEEGNTKRAGKKAEGILAKLEDEYSNGNKDMRPTVVNLAVWHMRTFSRLSDYVFRQQAEDPTLLYRCFLNEITIHV